MTNDEFKKALPGTQLDYFDAEAAIEQLAPGAYAALPYTAKVLAENLVRRCDPESLEASLGQIIHRKRELDFPGSQREWFVTTYSVRPHWLTSPVFATPLRQREETRPR